MTNVNEQKANNIKKIIIACLVLSSVVLIVLALIKPKKEVKTIKTTTPISAKKENLNGSYSFNFKTSKSESNAKPEASKQQAKVAKTASNAAKPKSNLKNTSASHKVPLTSTTKAPAPVVNAVACGKMDTQVQQKVDAWQTLFTKANIDAKIGNNLPQNVKDKLYSVKNKKDLINAIIFFLDNDNRFKNQLSKHIQELKDAGNDEEKIKPILETKISPNLIGKLDAGATAYLLTAFKGTSEPQGWDVIKDFAANKGILLPIDYSKDNCAPAPQASQPKPVVVANNNSQHSSTSQTSTSQTEISGVVDQTCPPLKIDDKFHSRILEWRKFFTKDSLVTNGVADELPANIVDEIAKVTNKRELIDIIIKFLAANPDTKDIAEKIKNAADDEAKIQEGLMDVALKLMNSKQKTVVFLTKVLMGDNNAWDIIRDDAKAENIVLPINYGTATENCHGDNTPQTTPKIADKFHSRILEWRKFFTKDSLVTNGVADELPANIVDEIAKVTNKRELIDIIIKFLAANPDTKDIAEKIKNAADDEAKIQEGLMDVALKLMNSKQKTVVFLTKVLMGDNNAWDIIRDDAKAENIVLPINYNAK